MFREAETSRRGRISGVVLLATLMLVVVLMRGGSLPAAGTSEAASLDPALDRVAALANGSGWLRVRYNVSQTSDRSSAWPRIALGQDGEGNDQYVAVVWSDGYSSEPGAGHLGHVYLRWVDEVGGDWSSRILVDNVGTADANNWAAQPALAVAGTTAHVVWAQRSGSDYMLCYRRYDLVGDFIDQQPDCFVSTSEDVSRPDIALDGSDPPQPHVVWQQGADEDQRGYYRYRTSLGNWQTDTDEYTGLGPDGLISYNYWDNEIVGKHDHPSLVVSSDGSVVVVWSLNNTNITELDRRNDLLRYRQRTPAGDWGERPVPLFNEDDPFPDHNKSISANPVVASHVNTDTVYAVWDKHLYDEVSAKKEFRLYAKKSTDGGATWTPPDTDDKTWLPLDGVEYESVTRESGEIVFSTDLQPAASVDGEGNLHVVWHRHLVLWDGPEKTYDQYDVMYWSNSTNITSTLPITVATLSYDGRVLGDDDHPDVAADVAVGYWKGEWHLHVVVMLLDKSTGKWDVHYLGNYAYANNDVYLPIVMRNH